MKEPEMKSFNDKIAAVIILKDVIKNKKRILVGADAYIMDLLLKLFPVRFTKVMAGKLSPDHISP